jgi:hypothetical protein
MDEQPAVIDNGTGVYLWRGQHKQAMSDQWVFMALYRCEHCGREVTIVRFDRANVDERSLRRMKACPGGCASVQQWLEPAAAR